jgi:hypothetical protein
VRPLKDGCGTDGEIEFALVAAVEPALANRDALTGDAGWADRARGPKPSLKVEASGFGVRDEGEELEGANGGLAHLDRLSYVRIKARIVDIASIIVAFETPTWATYAMAYCSAASASGLEQSA